MPRTKVYCDHKHTCRPLSKKTVSIHIFYSVLDMYINFTFLGITCITKAFTIFNILIYRHHKSFYLECLNHSFGKKFSFIISSGPDGCSGGSRFSRGGAPKYYLAIFCRKLHQGPEVSSAPRSITGLGHAYPLSESNLVIK